MSEADKFHFSDSSLAKIADAVKVQREDLRLKRERRHPPGQGRFITLVGGSIGTGMALAAMASLALRGLNETDEVKLHDFGPRGEGGTAGPVQIGGADHLKHTDPNRLPHQFMPFILDGLAEHLDQNDKEKNQDHRGPGTQAAS